MIKRLFEIKWTPRPGLTIYLWPFVYVAVATALIALAEWWFLS